MTMQNNQYPELAPCGIYCGACPSLNKTCYGCASEDHTQKRTSKWSCKLRACCYSSKNKQYCIDCDQFPCQPIKHKLIDSHPDDLRYQYRHEIADNFKMMKKLGTDDYLAYLNSKWACPVCGGRIYFYHYRCGQCGKRHPFE